MSTLNVTKKEPPISSSPPSIREEASLENLTSKVAAIRLSKQQLDSRLNVHEVTLLEEDVGISFERLIFLQNIELPKFIEAPGYPLIFASWILGAPDLFNDLLRITPQDRGSAQVFKEHFNQMVINPLFKERQLKCIDGFFHRLTYTATKVKKITEKTLATPFHMKTQWCAHREISFNHRIKLEEEDQPRAIEYFTRLLFQTGHTETVLAGALQFIHIPRAPKEPAPYHKVWCLDQFLTSHGLIRGGESKYIVLVREQHWKTEEEYAILPVLEFSVGESKYRLKSFSTINIDDECVAYLKENNSLFQIQSTSFFCHENSIIYFNETDILNNMEAYIKASKEEKKLLENPLDDFMIELMGSLDSCIYEKVSSGTF